MWDTSNGNFIKRKGRKKKKNIPCCVKADGAADEGAGGAEEAGASHPGAGVRQDGAPEKVPDRNAQVQLQNVSNVCQ